LAEVLIVPEMHELVQRTTTFSFLVMDHRGQRCDALVSNHRVRRIKLTDSV